MELLLKMTEGQLPFIGVIFDNVIDACEMNQNLINEKHADEYHIIVEQPSIEHVNFKIFGQPQTTGYWHYNKVKCDPKDLNNWLYLNSGKHVNFGHILRAFEKDTLVRTKDKYEPFKLEIIRIYMTFYDGKHKNK